MSSVDGGWLQDATVALDAARAAGDPITALVGPFDAGKSSLLKRLCIETGTPTPDRLYISGEPATTSVDEVRIGSWIIRDTPGLESEHANHDAAGFQSALSAERTMLVLLPNLFAEDSITAELVRQIEPGAVTVILSRIDKAVMSPTPAAITKWGDTKTREVRELLARLGHQEIEVFLVAADPGGRVGNRPANADRFDGTRDWDGVAGLLDALQQPCPPRLRALAAERRVRIALQALEQDISKRRHKLGQHHAEQQAEIERIAVRLREVDRLMNDARQGLTAQLVEAAQDGAPAGALPRIRSAADRWAHEWDRVLAARLSEWELDPIDVVLDLGAIQLALDQEAAVAEVKDPIDFTMAEEALRAKLKTIAPDDAEMGKLEAQLADYERAKREHRVRTLYEDETSDFNGIRDVRQTREELRAKRRRQVAIRAANETWDVFTQQREIARQGRERHAAEQLAREEADAFARSIATTLFGTIENGGARDAFDAVREQLLDIKAQCEETLESLTTDLSRLEDDAQRVRHRATGLAAAD